MIKSQFFYAALLLPDSFCGFKCWGELWKANIYLISLSDHFSDVCKGIKVELESYKLEV